MPVVGSITSPGFDGIPGVNETFPPTTAGSVPTVSLPITGGVVPPVPPLMGVPLKSSSRASMIGAGTVVLLLPPVPTPPLLSLPAPVVPVKSTPVCDVLPPPGVPGAV